MALVRFTRGTDTIALDLQTEREWAAPFSGRAGVATIEVPHDSPAASSTYIDPATGSTVRISGQGGAGEWVGYVSGLAFSESAIRVSAVQPWAILGKRIIQRRQTIRNASPGYVATVVLRETLPGLPWFRPVLPFGGGPQLVDYTLDGQDAWSVLSDLMNTTQGELHIDAASGRMTWCGPLAYASVHDGLLVAGSDLQGAEETVAGDARVSQVIATSGGQWYVASRAAASGWATQAALTVDDPTQLARAAAVELAARSLPAVTVTGSVTSEWWSIRERDYLRVLLPHAGFGGRAHTCRVLARSLADGAALMRLELQVIDPAATLALGTAARQTPPNRSGKDVSTTRGKSFAALFTTLTRSVADIERDRTTTR